MVYKKIICSIILIFSCLLFSSLTAAAESPSSSKVIVCVVDGLDLSDFNNTPLNNFQQLAQSGAVGLMNTRTKTLFSDSKASAYLTIGMGLQIKAPVENPLVETVSPLNLSGLNQDEIHSDLLYKLQVQDIKELRKAGTESAIYPGRIGDIAARYGKKTGLLGNYGSGRPISYAALMAMDSKGIIDVGNIKHAFDTDRFINLCNNAIRTTDILFVDFGDVSGRTPRESTSVTDQGFKELRLNALKKVDSFLGELIEIAGKQNAVLVVLSPTALNDQKVGAFRHLAPFIIYGDGYNKGVITSNTTRRAGLVSNIDVAPTILKLAGIKPENHNFIGEEIRSVKAENPKRDVKENLDRYIHLKVSRYIIHGIYIFLLLIITVLVVRSYRNRDNSGFYKRKLRALAVMIMALPAFSMYLPLVVKSGTLYLDVVLILSAVVVAGCVCSRSVEGSLRAIGVLSAVTALFITISLLSGHNMLLDTPLGFNDIFSGGRYYGINNDSMGILLGSSVFSGFWAAEILGFGKVKTFLMCELIFVPVCISQIPAFGANVGGTITALATGLITGVVLLNPRPPNARRILMLVVVVILAELAIAYTDTFNGNRTHAGKVIHLLVTGPTLPTLFNIIKSKLGVFVTMLIIPPWNIMLFAQVLGLYILFRRYQPELTALKTKYPLLTKAFLVILYAGFTAFVFNDTGVIATALMLTYLTMPLVVFLTGNYNLGEYRI